MKKEVSKITSSSGQAAVKLLHGLTGVFKKLALYPDTHPVYLNALNILRKNFDDHFGPHGDFRLQVGQNSFFYNDTLVYEGIAEPTDMAYLLHRDGIVWIAFQEGLQLWEIDTFLKLLRDYAILDEDPEDDIVTALWAINLPSIVYETIDPELGLHDGAWSVDLQRPVARERAAVLGEKNDPFDQCEGHGTDSAKNVLMFDDRNHLWELTAKEKDQLRHMVAVEEKLSGSGYAIDALLYILENHCLEEDLSELFDTLFKEMCKALSSGRFAYLLEAVARLKKDVIGKHNQNSWLAPQLERFFRQFGGASFLNGLMQAQRRKHGLKDRDLKDLKRLLLALDTSAVKTLGLMMPRIQHEPIQRVVLEVIGTMARSDFDPLEKLIAEADPMLAGRLVFLLGFLKDARSRHVLSNLLGHPSALVRGSALKAVLARDGQAVDEIFSLIDDPDEKIRKLVLARLGRQRSVRIEKKLLDYLDKGGPILKDREHFISVCIALGKCGSDRCLPYLAKMLFKWRRIGLLRSDKSQRRQGAAAALQSLRTQKAEVLIDRNERGFMRNLFRGATMF